MRLKTFFHPRKTRKSRNKPKDYFSVVNHPMGVTVNCGIHLNVFVFFRAFRGQMGFLA
jgi:hypothetical protein